MQRKLNWHGDLFTNGENLHGKNLTSDFKVTILENPLLLKQAVTSKGIPVPYTNYSWTFTPIPNWTCSVVTIFHFQCTAPSTWLANCADPNTQLNHQLEKDVGYKVINSSHDEDQEIAWSQISMVYKHNSFFKRKKN